MTDPDTAAQEYRFNARVIDPDAPADGNRPVQRVQWWLSPAPAASVATALLLCVAGVLAGRVEVIGLAAPLLLNTLWCWLRRPRELGAVDLQGQAVAVRGRLGATLAWSPAVGAEQLRVRVLAPGHRPGEVLLGIGSAVPCAVSIATVRTGRRPVFGLQYAEVGPQQVVRHDVRSLAPVPITVLPRATALRGAPLPFRLQGLTGPHGSRRPGDGGDLHDVTLFGPGDRLRRIDWRVTARRADRLPGRPDAVSELYVRRTFATADAAVMLVLDSRDEVGPDVGTWGDSSTIREQHATSLDHARNAALTFAQHYLELGDRVGLEDLGRLRRPMPPAGGRRQLARLGQRIALSAPEGEPRPRHRSPRLPSGALVGVCSTFLDDDPLRLAQLWRSAGHRVIAVDVLPPVAPSTLPERLRTAYRIVALERQDRLSELDLSGVEVVHWVDRDGTTLDAELAALTRKRARR